jgi:hypothetical protein
MKNEKCRSTDYLSKKDISCVIIYFYGSHGITHALPIFKGVRELTFRQIDQYIISGWCFIPIMAISSEKRMS